MSRQSYEQYGLRADLLADPYMASARLPKDRAKMPHTIDDVVQKLELEYSDRVLDIGCGVGDLIMGFHFRVTNTLGVDHPNCVGRVKHRLPLEDRVRVVAGNWLDLELKESFSKILVYDAIHYLTDAAEVERFAFKAAALLESRGRMLIGDLPSADMRVRHDQTNHGRAYNINWNNEMDKFDGIHRVLREPAPEEEQRIRAKDPDVVKLDDNSLIGLMTKFRASGYQAWLVPQRSALPFAVQREDLIVTRP